MTERLAIWQVHAFTSRLHQGNPAGVCISEAALSEWEMARIAAELRLPVTAFIVDQEIPVGGYGLRWFTYAGKEVRSFCGHATFAAAHVLRGRRGSDLPFAFSTLSGIRQAAFDGARVTIALPSWPARPFEGVGAVGAALRAHPSGCFHTERDLLVTFADARQVMDLRPDFGAMLRLGDVGVIATAATGPTSIAFRFFCPSFGIGEDEDQATGSAHSSLGPFWHQRLGVSLFDSVQLSHRTGQFQCVQRDGNLSLTAQCVTFLDGHIEIDRD